MKKLSLCTSALCASVLALFAGSAAVLQSARPGIVQAIDRDLRVTHSAAFRDGLYLGRLAAERGDQMHVAVGRWAAEADRALFKAGFQQGYQEFVASRGPAAAALRAE